MRLLLLSLLALAAHAQNIGYRSILQAYSPARGEFPVRSELAQGYVRYLDNTGAERLIAYTYPEPLYGIRSEQYVNEQVNPLLRSSFLTEQEQKRAAVPGLSPEVQRARDEHLRVWSEDRRQVIQSELAQAGQAQNVLINTQTIAKPQPIFKALEYIAAKPAEQQPEPQQITAKPVQETEEVYRARQEHLRRYNEALQQIQANPIQAEQQPQLIKSIPIQNIEPQQSPQPVEETPEVKRAREEHLKQYNEVIQRQTSEAQAQPIVPAINIAVPLPEATIRSSIPTSYAPLPTAQSATHEQQIQYLNKIKLTAEDKVADIEDRIRYEEQERAAERLRELELREQEQKQAELERIREEQRSTEERRLFEAERIALQQQEKERIESERFQESKRLQLEQEQQQQEQQQEQQQAEQQLKTITEQQAEQQIKTLTEQSSSYKKPAFFLPAPSQPVQIQPQAIAQQQAVQNSFILRFHTNQIQPSAVEPNLQGYVLAEHAQNPFLLRYIQQPQQAQLKVIKAEKAEISPSSSSSFNGLSQLEQANREHFKAHETALEQLRLANLNAPKLIPCQ